MPRLFCLLFVVGFGLVQEVGSPAHSQMVASAPSPETPGLKATQVTVLIEKDRKQRRFRANILARQGDELVILTAAHCMSESDSQSPVIFKIDGEVVEGTITNVVRNPAYQSRPNFEIPGADNAVARLRMKKPTNRPAAEAYDSLKPVRSLVTRSYPSPDGQTVSVRMIDGHGVEHALKAGNHRNPRYLEWGLSYKPIPGDSGGGVFVVRNSPDGEPQAVLIGIIVGCDDKGGAASLVSREMPWIAAELAADRK